MATKTTRRDLVATSEAAIILGVGTTTIKRWAEEGNLPFVLTVGGHRRFEKRALRQVLRSQKPLASGTTLGDWWQLLVEDRDPHRVQAALLTARSHCETWSEVAEMLGQVVEGIGELWERDQCGVFQEHIATATLEQALSECSIALVTPSESPCVLLATVEDDLHAVGLSLLGLCARGTGWQYIALRPPTPTSELVRAIEELRVDLVAVSASLFSDNEADLLRHHQAISETCRRVDSALVVGGRGAWPHNPEYGSRVESLEDFGRLLNEWLPRSQ